MYLPCQNYPERYLTNVLLKINTKLGGINSLLATEKPSSLPYVTDVPTMILGMDVSHGPPDLVDRPSIAAVVGSLSWPLISRYRVSLRTQPPRTEIIDSLFNPLENGTDAGSISELLNEFFVSSEGQKPKHIVVFRDGVSESQFSQVLNIELEQIKQAYLGFGEAELPKFTVIVAQKRHHTRFFPVGATSNVPPGTIVDSEVVHPTNYDFYMCAHGGMIGTLRPVTTMSCSMRLDSLQMNFKISFILYATRTNGAPMLRHLWHPSLTLITQPYK